MNMATVKNSVTTIKPLLLQILSHPYGSRILHNGKFCSTFKFPQINYQQQRSFIRITQKTEARLKLTDNIPKEYELIYRAPMLTYLQIAQTISSVSIVSLIGIGLYKISAHHQFTFPLIAHSDTEMLGDFSNDPATLAFLVGSFLLFNLGIFSVALRYPHRIYHNPASRSYIGILAGIIPFQIRRINFKNGDIMRKETIASPILPWRDAIFKISKRTLFIIENYFKTPAEFNAMLRKL